MNENRLMQQVTAIFSVLMVFFYAGLGVFFIWFFEASTIDKPVRVIFGSAFLLYGVYRAFMSYEKIKVAFFTKRRDDDDDYYRERPGRGGLRKRL